MPETLYLYLFVCTRPIAWLFVCSRPLCLSYPLLSELYELRDIVCSRRVGVKRPLLPPDTEADEAAGNSRAARENGDLPCEKALDAQELANATDVTGGCLNIANEF